jgi:tetratricopeptide (TPR) repeat protein
MMRAHAWQYLLFLPVSLFFAVCSLAEPYQHPETGIIFPEQLAGLKMISVTDYEKEKPGLGISIGYGDSSGTATIYLYNLGIKAVPEDIDSPHFKKHFIQVLNDVIRAGDNGPYHNVKMLSEEELFIGNSQTGIKALSASFSYVMVHNRKEVLSKLYLMSWNNHFLKLRFTYHKDMRIQGEETLKQLIGELSMMITSGNLKLQATKKYLLHEKNVEDHSHVNSKTENTVIELKEFIKDIEIYLGLNPHWKNEGWMARAVAYMKTGSPDQFNALISYSDGVDAAANGNYAEALMRYENAIRLDPLFPWSANNLAWVLSTCRDERLRDGRRAIEFALQAIKVPKVEVPDFVNTLAAAYATAGDFDTAVQLCRKSVEMWPREVFKEMLRCYLDKTLYIALGPTVSLVTK